MRIAEHVQWAFVFAFIAPILLFLGGRWNPQIALMCMAVTIASCMLPDFLEPALTYLHRGIFHSVYFLFFLITLAVMFFIEGDVAPYFLNIPFLNELPNLYYPYFNYLNYFLIAFCMGPISHLLGDASTPMGLPGNPVYGLIFIFLIFLAFAFFFLI